MKAQAQKHLYSKLFFLGFLLLIIFLHNSAFATQFSGIVLNTKGQPIDEAVVRLQGTRISTFTDQKGRFTINIDNTVRSKYITAWKAGFYNSGQPFPKKAKEYSILLKSIPPIDNEKYSWIASSHNQTITTDDKTEEEKACQSCHPMIVEEWKNSAHSTSAKNPLFLSFFNGTNKNKRKIAGPGYKLDFPNSQGNCAACHVPALALDNPFNSDPNKAQGAAKEGVFCDFCHKIVNTGIDRTGGYPGILSIQFQRQAEGRQIFFGPYDDSFPGDNSYHPLYKDSRYCAPCHNGRFWNVLAYSEFQEWAESSYAKKGVQCQDCHMKPTGKMSRFALQREGGILRNPSTIPSHINYGVRNVSFMSDAIELETHATLKDNILTVSVILRNVKAGHHYPTGSPMRNMILLVDAVDKKGKPLPMTTGERVPTWGGVGTREDGNYAGLPGKGFAKVLKDLALYPDGQRRRRFQKEYPAPHWRPTLVESDNRIPAHGFDTSNYQFLVPETLSGHISVTARLIYRRAFKRWLDAKGFKIEDIEIAKKNLIIRR